MDVVETGRTLRDNGLVELEEIVACQAMVIVNRVSYRLRLAEIRQLLAALVPEATGEPLAAQLESERGES